MPPVQNSPQYQELTISTNGRNVGASLQAVSHFFLEDNAFTQSAGEAFGVVSATEFATTAKVSFTGSKKVYAICQGQLFVQPHESDVNKVNVILKPFKYPINSLAIKYFVYRGLNKSDFFDNVVYQGANRLKIAGSETTGSGLVQHLWKEFNMFYTGATGGAPVFLEEFIGFPATPGSQPLTDFIDQYFFKIATYDEQTNEEIPGFDFELPLIPRGLELGTATGEVGIDVVLNQGDFYYENDPCPFRFDLSFARSAFHKLKTEAIHTAYQNKLVKEMCMQFIDIAAFYGLHASGRGKLYVGTATLPLESKEDIYTRIQNFYTKNTVYLYIQSNRQRSYNFYGNYIISENSDNNIQIGNTESNLTESVFGNQGWPVHEFNDNWQEILLSLVAENTQAVASVRLGNTSSEKKDSFIILEKEDASEENLRAFTKKIYFNNATVQGECISSIIQIVYSSIPVIIRNNNDENLDIDLKDIDDLFTLNGAISYTDIDASNAPDISFIFRNDIQFFRFNNYNNATVATVSERKVFDSVILNDTEVRKRVTYEIVLNSIMQEVIANIPSLSTNKENITTSKYYTNQNFYQLENPYYIENISFTDSGELLNGMILHTTDNSAPTKQIIGLSASEDAEIKNFIENAGIYNTRLFLKSTLAQTDDSYISNENIQYKKFILCVLGEVEDSNIIRFLSPAQEITLYSLDNNIYFSKMYSDAIEQKNLESVLKKFEIPLTII